MTEKQLRAKIKDCMKTDKAFIQNLIDKAIASGCMDITGAENNYLLAKNLLTAVYREMSSRIAKGLHWGGGKLRHKTTIAGLIYLYGQPVT